MIENSDVFELVENTKEQVIIKVNTKTPLEVAKHPYLSAEYEYITVTKGRNHIFTIIYKNGNTQNFDFEESGYTLISDTMTLLKTKIIEFIENNGIMIDVNTCEKPIEACIYYNSNFENWQATLTYPNREEAFYS